MINKEDLKVWLNDPCTRFFYEWMQKNKKELLETALNRVSNNFHKNERDENATQIFGVCRGLDTVINVINECEHQAKREVHLKDGVEADQDIINAMINYVYGKTEEENGEAEDEGTL